jgi:hypothetical protein
MRQRRSAACCLEGNHCVLKKTTIISKGNQKIGAIAWAYLALLVTTQLEVLAALEGLLRLVLALNTFHTKHDLLGGLGLRRGDRIAE